MRKILHLANAKSIDHSNTVFATMYRIFSKMILRYVKHKTENADSIN